MPNAAAPLSTTCRTPSRWSASILDSGEAIDLDSPAVATRRGVFDGDLDGFELGHRISGDDETPWESFGDFCDGL